MRPRFSLPHLLPTMSSPSRPHAQRTRCVPSLLFLALMLLALLAPSGCARVEQESGSGVRLQEGWRYRWGAGPQGAHGVPAWAEESGDGAAWLPTAALRTPPGREGQRLLWLSIPLPEGPWQAPGLLLTSVSNVLEVYVDGERLHASGTLDPEGYESAEHSTWQVLSLPRSALGKRVLLRVQSSGSAIGVRGDARVGERDALRVQALRGAMDEFLTGALLLMLAGAAAVLFFAQGRPRPRRASAAARR